MMEMVEMNVTNFVKNAEKNTDKNTMENVHLDWVVIMMIQ
jgi:hypothetical protein